MDSTNIPCDSMSNGNSNNFVCRADVSTVKL